MEDELTDESERVTKYIKMHKNGQPLQGILEQNDGKLTRLPVLYAYEGAHNRKNTLDYRFPDDRVQSQKREKSRYKCC